MKTLTAEQFKAKYGNPVSVPVAPVKSTVGSRVANTITSASQGVNEAISGTGAYQGQGTLARSFGATASAFNAIPGVAYDVMPAPVRQGIDWTSNKIGEGFNYLTGKLSDTKLFKDLGQLEADGYLTPKNSPGYFRTKELLNVAGLSGQIAGDILIADQASKVSQAAVNTVKSTTNKVMTRAGDAVSSGTTALGEATANTPASIMQRVARISKGNQAKFEKLAGESVGTYLAKRGIFGDIEDVTTKLYNRFEKSVQASDDAIAQLKGVYDPAPVKTMLKDLLDRETRVSTPGAPAQNLARLQALSQKKAWNMTEINEIKRLYERTVKVDYLKSINPEGVARATNLDSALRTWQVSQAETLGLKNLPRMRKETQLAKQLLDTLGKEYSGQAGNNAISLTDWIMLSGGNPQAIAGFLVKKTLSSKYIQGKIAEFVNRGNPILQDIGPEVGPTKVLNLPAPSSAVRSSVGSGSTIPVAPRGANMELTGQTGITNTKRTPPQSLGTQSRISSPNLTTIPKELQPLAQAAMKYKSAVNVTGGHGLDSIPKNTPTINIKTSLLGKEILIDTRDLTRQTQGKLTSDYWLKKIKGGERPPVLVDYVDGKLKVIDGNHRAAAYKETGVSDIPVILTKKAQSQLTDIWNKVNKKK